MVEVEFSFADLSEEQGLIIRLKREIAADQRVQKDSKGPDIRLEPIV